MSALLIPVMEHKELRELFERQNQNPQQTRLTGECPLEWIISILIRVIIDSCRE